MSDIDEQLVPFVIRTIIELMRSPGDGQPVVCGESDGHARHFAAQTEKRNK